MIIPGYLCTATFDQLVKSVDLLLERYGFPAHMPLRDVLIVPASEVGISTQFRDEQASLKMVQLA